MQRIARKRISESPVTKSFRFACKIIFKIVSDWRSANSLMRGPPHGTLEQNWRVRNTAEYQRLIEASIHEYARTAIRVMWRHPEFRPCVRERESQRSFFYKPRPEDPAVMWSSCHRTRGLHFRHPFFLARVNLSIFLRSVRYWRGDSTKGTKRDVNLSISDLLNDGCYHIELFIPVILDRFFAHASRTVMTPTMHVRK